MPKERLETNTSEIEPVSERQKLGWGPFSALVLTTLAYLFSQLVLVLPLVVVLLFRPGQDIQTVLDNSPILNFILSALSALTIILVLWVFLRHKKLKLRDLGFKKFKKSDFGWLVIGVAVYFVLLAVALALANHIPGFDANQSQNIGYQGVSGWQLALAFVGLVVLPPLAEEMLFRGFLYRGLASRWPRIVAALVASGLFAAVHFQWNVSLDVFVLSLVLIAMYERTKNLWVCIGLHAIKNGIAFLALFVFVSR